MRRGFIVASLAIAPMAIALAACLVDTSGLSGGTLPTTPEAGAADVGPPETISTSDAGADADASHAVDACVPILSQPDAGNIVPLTGFDLVGIAAVDGNTVALTPDEMNQAGALWSSAVASFDHFDVTFGFSITASAMGGAADGMAFAWVDQDALPALADNGADLGLQGLNGYGIVIDEYGEGYPVTAPVLAVVDLTRAAPGSWSLDAATLPSSVTDGNEHSIHVTFDAGVVTIRLDGAVQIDHFTLPGYAPFQGRWGFGAATGGMSATHRVTRVSFVDPSSSCQ